MAPEQAAGEAVDARCDLFSLGCVLYLISTGALPFQGPNAVTTLVAVMHRQPLTPLEVCPDVPAGLSTLVMQLLGSLSSWTA
jgi:serine/threonine protein kinase